MRRCCQSIALGSASAGSESTRNALVRENLAHGVGLLVASRGAELTVIHDAPKDEGTFTEATGAFDIPSIHTTYKGNLNVSGGGILKIIYKPPSSTGNPGEHGHRSRTIDLGWETRSARSPLKQGLGTRLPRRVRSSRSTRSNHFYDSATHMVACGVLYLAFLPVHLELQRGAHNKLRRLDRAAQFSAANVFVGRRVDDEIVLLVLLLFAGGAHGLQIFKRRCCGRAGGQSGPGKQCGKHTQTSCFVENHRFSFCAQLPIF